ncbi:MAG: sialidase family protein [Planctomycetota bacterium]|nr:sialidase family protein [Planctomycetota bacterium]
MRKSLALAVAVLVATPLAAQNARAPQLLSSGSQVYGPSVVSSGDLSAVAWKDAATNDIYVSTSDGRGTSWSAPVRVDDDTTGAWKGVYDYSMAVDGGSIYLAWRDERNGVDDCYFSVSNDNGATWSANTRLDDGNTPGAKSVDQAQISVSGSNVYVVMRVDKPTGSGENIWLASSNDGGVTWNPSLRADSDLGDCDYQDVCGDGANVYVVFCDDRNATSDDDLFFIMSHDGGLSWMMPEVQIDPSGPANGDIEGTEIHLSVIGQNAVVAWMEDELLSSSADEEVHFMYSADGGHSWNPEVVLHTGSDGDNQYLAFDGSTVAVAWEDNSLGSDEISVAISSDFGATWTTSMVSSGGGGYPTVAGNGDTWGVAWTGPSYPEGSMLAVSRDYGASFNASVDCAAGSMGDSDYAEMSHNALYNNFVCAWLDDDLGTNSCYAGGARSATLTPVSASFTPGDTIHFEASGFPASDSGSTFVALLSSGTGNYMTPFGDNRSTGLLDNPYIPSKMPLLSGTIDAFGNGSTAVGALTIPGVPAGSIFYTTGVAFTKTGGYVFGDISDVAEIVIM